jgi:hypothetical protein
MSGVLLFSIAVTVFVLIMILVTVNGIVSVRKGWKKIDKTFDRSALIKSIRLGYVHVEDLTDEVLLDVLDYYHSGDTWDVCVRDIVRRREERLSKTSRNTGNNLSGKEE